MDRLTFNAVDHWSRSTEFLSHSEKIFICYITWIYRDLFHSDLRAFTSEINTSPIFQRRWFFAKRQNQHGWHALANVRASYDARAILYKNSTNLSKAIREKCPLLFTVLVATIPNRATDTTCERQAAANTVANTQDENSRRLRLVWLTKTMQSTAIIFIQYYYVDIIELFTLSVKRLIEYGSFKSKDG